MAQSETDVQARAQSDRIVALESTYAHLLAGAKLLVTLALRT